ncbi:MAG TPA: hypothetical protein PKJ86_00280 [Candidatus Dojkabacteria bacterium]|nr:hypothetical protein [Candidatus Dojkabacteria bacterium]HQG57941.1 hypothetical protein [Candidatus Dojkabacteria bacterium]
MFKIIAKIVYTILVLIETLIAIRFVLKLIEASSGIKLVDIVYRYSDFFLSFLNGIVPPETIWFGFHIDLLALLGLGFYMILAFVAIELIRAFSN